MKHTYKISGMSCDGCRSHVEKTLNKISGVKKATVDLRKAVVEIEMRNHVPLEKLQEALRNSHYQISLPEKKVIPNSLREMAPKHKIPANLNITECILIHQNPIFKQGNIIALCTVRAIKPTTGREAVRFAGWIW